MDRPIQQVLAEWRDAERRLNQLAPDDVGRPDLEDEVAQLRVEHQEHLDAAGPIAEELARPPGPQPLGAGD